MAATPYQRAVAPRLFFAAALSFGLVGAGLLVLFFQALSLDVVGAALGGPAFDRAALNARVSWWAVYLLVGAGLWLFTTFGTAAGVMWWVETAGGWYQLQLLRRVRAERFPGVEGPIADRTLRWAALELEEEGPGWRPDTVLRWLEVTKNPRKDEVDAMRRIAHWAMSVREQGVDLLQATAGQEDVVLEVGGVGIPVHVAMYQAAQAEDACRERVKAWDHLHADDYAGQTIGLQGVQTIGVGAASARRPGTPTATSE